MQLSRCFLEFLVFDQLANQIPARIIFIDIFFWRLLIDREKAAAFQINEICRHDDEFAGDVDVQFLERLEILKVLAGDSFKGDFMDVDLIAFDEIEQQIERAFENLEFDLVICLHRRRL